MKKLLFILILTTQIIQAQSWQWGKSGGGAGGVGSDVEEVYSIVTDSQKNVYILSYLFDYDQQVDGQPVDFYGESGGKDLIISSFACDGSYRWSKVIGGYGPEHIENLAIDGQDNLYIAGNFYAGDQDPFYPKRIGNDLVINYNSNNFRTTFICKLNNLGSLIWIKMPQPNGTSSFDTLRTYLSFSSTDNQGNSYVLAALTPGVYCDGLFSATVPNYDLDGYENPLYILKYDSNGNFINGTFINFRPKFDFKFVRNHSTGQFFAYGYRLGNRFSSFAGQTLQNSAYVACYDSNAQFLWKTENVDTSAFGATMQTQNITFDEQNNIYLSLKMQGNLSNPGIFLGFTPNITSGPATILKINSTGQNLLWGTNSSSGIGDGKGAIEYKNSKLGLTNQCAGANYIWGNQTMSTLNISNQGLVPLLAQFNPSTGACVGLSHIPNSLQTYDSGTAIAIDASGDFIVGGRFGSELYVGPNTLTASGASDFFIAKYSTTACSPLEVKSNEKPKNTLVAYPNPTNSIINICVNEACNFNIYSTTGAIVQKGIISREENTIDISKLASGAYTIVVITPAGLVSEVKVLKE